MICAFRLGSIVGGRLGCDLRQCYFLFIFYFILFATLITKNIGKEEEEKKKEVARRPNRNYRSL